MSAAIEPVAAAPAFHCRVCGAAAPFETHRARERMFGWGDPFDYLLCGGCGCLQIRTIPPDLARFYGEGYYSFGRRQPPGRLTAMLARARNRHLSGRFDPLGGLLARWRPFLGLAALRPLRLAREARIVDVGCGDGELLLALQSAGFTRLQGVDPFIAADQDLGGGLRIQRAELDALDGPFDLVMFHHSLEHMGDQAGALRAARARLVPGGRCVVRIPTVSSWAWRHYGVDWCALDAPRHLYLHSLASIRGLAAACGFEVGDIACDSTAFQFWGSEQYRHGIALMRPGSHDIAPAPGMFSDVQLRNFAREAARLNRQGDGDQIVVYLQRRT